MVVSELLESSMGQETENPPWKLSIPHVLVATIVPFLFGYHLGFVLLQLLLPSFSDISVSSELISTIFPQSCQ